MVKSVGPVLKIPETRNPFSGKGLAVTLALLLRAHHPQTIAELADRAQTSRALASMVVRELRRLDLVVGEVSQGRAGALRPSAALVIETALHWPPPIASVIGGQPLLDEHTVGGGPAVRGRLPAVWDPPPRVYVRSTDEVQALLAESGGHLVAGGVSDWEIAVVDFPFDRGPLPLVVVALEVGATPRGREMLDRHAVDLEVDWSDDR